MGKIAEKYSDRIYLTDDNPRNENPSKIEKISKEELRKLKFMNYLIEKKRFIRL